MSSIIPEILEKENAFDYRPRNNKPLLNLCLFIFDIYAIFLGSLIAYKISEPNVPFFDLLFRNSFLLISIIYFSYILFKGLYWNRIPFWLEVKNIITITIVSLILDGFFQYLLKEHHSRLFIPQMWIYSGLLVITFRYFFKTLFVKYSNCYNLKVLVIDDSNETSKYYNMFKKETLMGYKIIDVVSSEEFMINKDKLIKDISEIIISDNVKNSKKIINYLVENKKHFTYSLKAKGLSLWQQDNFYIFGYDILFLNNKDSLSNKMFKFIKRTIDLFLGSIGLIIALPLFILSYILVKIDGGPALFGHHRIGENGKIFKCYKFRTMVVDADKKLNELLQKDELAKNEWEKEHKLKNDPRITRFGKFLRKTALDELPQIINVLKGEMSLVGPRPITESELEKYGDIAILYKKVKPGITGIWQVSGRNDISYEERVELDYWYTRNWTPWLDIVIIFKTIPALILRKGAY